MKHPISMIEGTEFKPVATDWDENLIDTATLTDYANSQETRINLLIKAIDRLEETVEEKDVEINELESVLDCAQMEIDDYKEIINRS